MYTKIIYRQDKIDAAREIIEDVLDFEINRIETYDHNQLTHLKELEKAKDVIGQLDTIVSDWAEFFDNLDEEGYEDEI